ncbi:MAG: hypothetical protein HY253_04595 [Burkholderiales bacterium]|nr:hypothetical protein [Burkholderiales bacterium]
MKLNAKRISATASGDYYQILLDSEDDDDTQASPFGQPAPYLLIQSQCESPDGGKCYVESDDEQYIGHFNLKLIEFYPTRLAFEITRKNHSHVEVFYALTSSEFDEALPIVEVIFGVKEPDHDAPYFDAGIDE